MTYESMRNICATGDVLGVKGTNWFSRLIMRVTREEFSHVALLVWHGSSLWVYEFVESVGYQCVPASWWFTQRKGQAVFYGRAPYVVGAKPQIVMAEANNFRGKKIKGHYGHISLIKVAIAQWIKKDVRVFFKVCSTFVQHIWQMCGVEFKMTADPGNIMRIAASQSGLLPVDTDKDLR